MHQHRRLARFLPRIGFRHWLGFAGLLALAAPIGCAEYEPSQLPGDDVAGLQADAGASGSTAGGSGGTASGGRTSAQAGSGAGVAGASVVGAAGASGGSSSGGAASGGAGSGASAGAHAAQAGSAPSAGSSGALNAAGTSGAPASAGQGGLGGSPSGAGGSPSSAGGSPGSAGSGVTPVVELSRGQAVSASSEQAGNEAPKGNDSDASLSTRWCALHGTFPQWWRVDLGAKHTLHDFSVRFEKSDRKYSYTVETSNDDSVYTVQSTINGMGSVQSDTFASGVSARYVRITVSGAEPFNNGTTTYPTWASFWDFSVNGW